MKQLRIWSMLLLIVIFSSLSAFGQEEHMKFMGIPIDGKVSKFDKKLREKGFTLIHDLNPMYFYKGLFAGKSASIFVYTETKTSLVYQVAVTIPCFTKEMCEDEYKQFKERLIYKYNCKKDSDIIAMVDSDSIEFAEKIKNDELCLNTYNVKNDDNGNEQAFVNIYRIDENLKKIAAQALEAQSFGIFKLMLKMDMLIVPDKIGKILLNQSNMDSLGGGYEHSLVIVYYDSANGQIKEHEIDEDL